MNPSSEELAALYVLDQLDPADRASFESRLLHEPELAALVRDLESGLAHGVRALPPRQPPADMFTRIEKQIGTARPLVADFRSSATSFSWVGLARWGIAAVIAVSLATLAVQSLRSSAARPMIVLVGLDTNRNTFTEVPLGNPTKDPDGRFIQLASLAETFWRKSGNLPVQPAPASGENRGYALFDPSSRQGFIAIEQLPVIAENQRYHLWIVDPTTARVSDAGFLPLAGMSRGLYSFALEPGASPTSAHPHFFVTVEDNEASSPSTQPRGKVVLGHQRI